MNKNIIWLSLIAVIISFIGGFLLANALNRSEINQLRSRENPSEPEKTTAQSSGDSTLSDEEIKKRISEADQNPDNFAFQKGLGLALYQYAGMKQDGDLLGEVRRILERAYQNNPNDYEVMIALGNTYFDYGLIKKDNESFINSRKYYLELLKINPRNSDVRTSLGLTYFLAEPPETDLAVAEFEKTLKENPNHEKALRAISQALIKQNKVAEAQKYISQLQKINPQNPFLSELQNQSNNPAESK